MRSATVSLKSLPSIDAGALGSIRGCHRFQLFTQRQVPARLSKLSSPSALGPSYKSISDENTRCECDWAQADSDRLVLHTV